MEMSEEVTWGEWDQRKVKREARFLECVGGSFPLRIDVRPDQGVVDQRAVCVTYLVTR